MPTFSLFCFCFCGLFFVRVRECCRPESTASTAQHSTAQHRAIRVRHVPIRARQGKQADRVGDSQHVVEHFYSSLWSQNEQINPNLPGWQTKKHLPMPIQPQKKKERSSAGVKREGFALLSISVRYEDNTALVFRSLYHMNIYFVHACGVRAVVPEHGALGIRKSSVQCLHLASWNLSIRFIRIVFYYFIVSLCARETGRSHPRSEARCTYHLPVANTGTKLLSVLCHTRAQYIHVNLVQ